MNDLNQTLVTEFILIGFKNIHMFKIALFSFLFIAYVAICIENILIISLVLAVVNLQVPMYIFLTNLSLCDVFISTDIVPNMLNIIWTGRGNITIPGCIIQHYIFASLGATECLLLAVMSYDRYLAICKPFSYSSQMSSGICRNFIIFFWIAGFTPTLSLTTCLSKMQFCRINTIDYIYCDMIPMMDLACSDVSNAKLLILSLGLLFTFFPFLLIIASYTCIIHAILRIKSNKGRQKAFSTCSSHLLVVSLFYGTLFILYGVPSESPSLNVNKMLSLSYIVVTPFLNPIIYSLKNQEIARAVTKLMKRLMK